MTRRRPALRAASTVAAVVLGAIVLGGCAARLAPAPGAPTVPGPGAGAAGRADDVRVIAYVDAWNASPRELPAIVTPIFVVIDNGGAQPLRLSHHDFALVTGEGARLPARSAAEVSGFVTVPAPRPAVVVAPRFSISFGFGGYRGWRFPYSHDPFFGDPFFSDDLYYYPYPLGVRVPLPTPDMIQLGLPEGRLEPGGRTTGFLYFDQVKRSAGRVDFTARLVGATDGAPIGTITIPFVTR
jgi:hypothetical protein